MTCNYYQVKWILEKAFHLMVMASHISLLPLDAHLLVLFHVSGPTLNKAPEGQSWEPRTTQMHSEHWDDLFLDT